MNTVINEIKSTLEGTNSRITEAEKITTDGDCSHEIKRRLLLGKKLLPT